MAQSSGPFDPVDPDNPVSPGETLAEAEWELMLDRWIDGVIGTPGGTSLRATPSGSTARGVDFAAGSALVRGHWYKSTAVETLTSDANSSGSARIDRAVLRLDRSDNSVTLTKLTGTAGAGPPVLADSATVTDRPLWRWTISPGATVATALVDERLWAPRPIRRCKDKANRPIDVQAGDLVFEMDTDTLLLYNGSFYRTVSATSGELYVQPAHPTLWEERSPLCFATRWNGVVYVQINLRRIGPPVETDSSDASTGSLLIELPEMMRPFRTIQKPVVLSGGIAARIRYQADGQVYLNAPTSQIGTGRFVRCEHAYLGG